MRKFLNAVILIPLGLIFIAFAVANRHAVTVSFDPFNSHDPSLGFTLPLFVVIIAVAVLGVVAGGATPVALPEPGRRAVPTGRSGRRRGAATGFSTTRRPAAGCSWRWRARQAGRDVVEPAARRKA